MKLDDVAGLEEAKQTLKEAVIIPVQFPNCSLVKGNLGREFS